MKKETHIVIQETVKKSYIKKIIQKIIIENYNTDFLSLVGIQDILLKLRIGFTTKKNRTEFNIYPMVGYTMGFLF